MESRFRFVFFFSSRRRHTRSLCDWSSDVCSSDLSGFDQHEGAPHGPGRRSDEQRGLGRSEEHTSELQSHHDLVCRLLLEKKKKKKNKQQKTKKKKKKKKNKKNKKKKK